jgi:signal transduction histidine kinase
MPLQRIAGLRTVVRIFWSIVALGVVAFADYHISHEANTTLFYYIPILIFSYNDKMPLKFSIIFTGVAAIVWGIVDRYTDVYEEGNYLGYNMISRWVSFSLVGMVLNRYFVEKKLRETIATQTQSLKETNDKLTAANEDLNRFVGMAAHDIRNPVGAIQMTSEMLLEEENINEETKGFLEMIHSAAANSLQILNDTLNISQIQSGTITLHMAKQDYIAFLKEDLRLNEYLTQRKKQVLRFESPIEKAEIVFDKSRLLQVINNLLTNAIKYSEPGTNIRVRVNWSDETKKSILTEVIDQGLGIDEKYHKQLFDPFTTTSNKTTGNESKTGLGLAIVKKIVALHNGTIGFTSEKGKGSTFFFTLPLDPVTVA